MSFTIAFTALIVGLCLGLLGAGGSIVLVPALMLLLDLTEKQAIAHALLIVPAISSIGAYQAWRAGKVDWRLLAWFALASVPASAIAARLGFLLPMGMQTVMLIVLLVLAAYKMWTPQPKVKSNQGTSIRISLIGAFSGLVTGMVGIGGGFLIVPGLTLFAGISIQTAVAMSLLMIVVNGLSAFIALHLSLTPPEIKWTLVFIMSTLGASAVVFAGYAASRMNQNLIKKLFAGVLVLVAAWLILDLM